MFHFGETAYVTCEWMEWLSCCCWSDSYSQILLAAVRLLLESPSENIAVRWSLWLPAAFLPCIGEHLSNGHCPWIRGKIIRTVLCCMVRHTVHSDMQTNMSSCCGWPNSNAVNYNKGAKYRRGRKIGNFPPIPRCISKAVQDSDIVNTVG